MNSKRDHYSFDYAFVECVPGQNAEEYLQSEDDPGKALLLERIGELLAKMHGDVREAYGKLNAPLIQSPECHLLHVKNAEVQLAYSVQYIDEIRANRPKLLNTLYKFAEKIKPRRQYRFIHGELGPDHILFNEKLEPYLIDIEGAMFFDMEYEHCFLDLRFGEYYRYLKSEALDPDRMQFYRLHQHISLISAGLKLLHRGFPDQQFAKGLAEYHCQRVLQFIQ
ncbi:phosphotransferase [Paenibacillus sp. PK3_47]|uniref:phosphotransferase n=1 Tax=Paenibacillus sp. PK3_47 TaxID=2072642 RepID=UPI0031844D4A